MATHSGILAWKIPGTQEPGGLPSVASQRVDHEHASITHMPGQSPRCFWHHHLFACIIFASLGYCNYEKFFKYTQKYRG